METASQTLIDELDESKEPDTFTRVLNYAEKATTELVATREALRFVIANTVADVAGEAEAAVVLNGGPLPEGYEFAPCFYDAMKVLGQRAREGLN
jgi:hypothetical protein